MNNSTTQKESSTYEVTPSEKEAVKLWTQRIKNAKDYFKDDFKRIQENMEFAAGLQWAGQLSLDPVDDKYVANILNHHVNQKVASLYARDPKCKSRRRDRLDFQLWDGTVATEQAAHQALMLGVQSGMATPQTIHAQQLLQDIEQGRAWRALCDKVGKTLEIVYGYQCDTQAPSFKFQMKQLVRRVITCGVGYVRLDFVRQMQHRVSSSLTDDSLAGRLKRAKDILSQIQEGKLYDESDPRLEEVRQLFSGSLASVNTGDIQDIEERLVFDFPEVTSIIIDPQCKCIKGFIGADWVAQQYLMPLEDANAYYELRGDKRITTGGSFVEYSQSGEAQLPKVGKENLQDRSKEPRGCFWQVQDLKTKNTFTVCDGYTCYVVPPKPPEVPINRFWNVFSLTFNDIEVEMGQKVKIYPPSDIQLLKPMQKERNRTGFDLREHRKGNKPFHWTMKAWLTEADKEKLGNHETHELIELEGSPINGDMEKAMGHWDGVTIDPNVYNRAPLDEDANLAVGSNQIQQQRPIRHVAATPAVIQEQARISDVNSNVDDLDDLLSELAQAGGEMILRGFQLETVKRIAGNGSAFPDDRRVDFLNEIYLDIVASSSGRPNKAVEIANFERIAPLIMQALTNPLLWPIVKEAIKRLDDRLEINDFIPDQYMQQLATIMMQQGKGISPTAKPSGGPSAPHRPLGVPGQPLQQLAGQSPVALPGHNQ